MKRFYQSITTVVISTSVLFGCSSNQEPTKPNEPKKIDRAVAVQNQIEVIISENNGKQIISDKKLGFITGENLLELMNSDYKITDGGGGFITSIDGISNDKSKNLYWFLEVNDKESQVGAKDIILKNNDKIDWDLHPYNK